MEEDGWRLGLALAVAEGKGDEGGTARRKKEATLTLVLGVFL
jgi:hypothetical protein